MSRAVLLALVLLAGCASVDQRVVPETVTIEGGTSVRHEVGDPAVRQNTLLGRATWRLR